MKILPRQIFPGLRKREAVAAKGVRVHWIGDFSISWLTRANPGLAIEFDHDQRPSCLSSNRPHRPPKSLIDKLHLFPGFAQGYVELQLFLAPISRDADAVSGAVS